MAQRHRPSLSYNRVKMSQNIGYIVPSENETTPSTLQSPAGRVKVACSSDG